ncbi:MAG: cytochrome c3 family protein [Bacteroidales bacterium]|nr:cytochrome c3 family protein [Bacteroidales bacterium]MCB9013950.1 cytochrome c3 family protein [Bacteroidales bacterium]
MRSKFASLLFIFFFILFGLVSQNGNCKTPKTPVQSANNPEDSPSYEDNQFCLRCHASGYFVLTSEISGKQKKQAMPDNFRIFPEKFYNGVHWQFGCTDCHSSEYHTFPHAAELRFDVPFACIDCHGGDEATAKYHFEEIQVEYEKSVHAKLPNDEFNCWKCHDPHSYAPLARRDTLTTDFVVSSNQMCLKCHGNFDVFQLLSEKKELTEVVKNHSWLPNQALHFRSVRCLECHSAQNQDILISHNIMPKDSAVHDCVRCHSGNSLLMGTLYKFRTVESRKSYGFVNAAIIDNNSYVIGANHSRFMNISGIIIIIMTLLAIAIHTIFRIRKSKN